jgi:hypothetical protein
MSGPPKHVVVGPLTNRLLSVAEWKPHNKFPVHQSWADEFERALVLLEDEGMLDQIIHRLKIGERGVWAEIWAANYFYQNGFKITQWEPEYVPGIPGDLEVVIGSSTPLFVEVKRPGWQGELTNKEYELGRHEESKNRNREARSYDNVLPIIHSVTKALPKFSAISPNVVVIVDDLFVTPLDDLPEVLSPKLDASLAPSKYDVVSGILLLNLRSIAGCVEYRGYFHRVRGIDLPKEIQNYFSNINSKSEWGS